MSSIYLAAGSTKYISIDREAAARGAPAWMVRLEAPYIDTAWMEVIGTFRGQHLQIYATEHNGVITCRGSKDNPLTPSGPAFWIETTAAVEVIT